MKLRSCVAALSCAAAVAGGIVLARPAKVRAATPPLWRPAQAAAWMDAREDWWQQWPRAQKDHGTVCVSCHTQLPYAMARPVLDDRLHQQPGTAEQAMIKSIETRVNGWDSMETFYSDAKHGPGKTAQSRATEALLNATMLAAADVLPYALRPVTRKAIDEAWALQLTDGPDAGGWPSQDFHLAPWETASSYQLAAQFYNITYNFPGYFQNPHTEALAAYLRRRYETRPVLDQLFVLCGDNNLTQLLTEAQRHALLRRLHSLRRADGGWSTSALDPVRRQDDSTQPAVSDAYATAIVAMATRDTEPTLHRSAITWLREHQREDGRWVASSLNKDRGATNVAALFMSDAATGYAALALSGEQQ